MNKQQKKIYKLFKIMSDLQAMNNPDFDGDLNKLYKLHKRIYRNITDEEYKELMAWCKMVQCRSLKKRKVRRKIKCILRIANIVVKNLKLI